MRRKAQFRGLAVAGVFAAAASVVAVTGQPAAAAPVPVGHFVVVGPLGMDLGRTEASVRAAGGQVLQSWRQVGVVVATSTRSDFAQRVRGLPDVQQAGASRALVEFLPGAASAAKPADRLARLDAVVSTPTAEPAALEPLAPNQWDMRMIRADRANERSGGSRNVLVGVLDTGVEESHPDLAANIDQASSVACHNNGVPDTSPGARVPSHFHGSHVAGIIAAAKNNLGIAGVAPGVRLASIRVVDDNLFIYPEYAICGFIWAAEHGVDVSNSSIGLDPWLKACRDDPDQRAIVEAMTRVLDYATGRDVVNIASAGNTNWDLSHELKDAFSPTNQTPVERMVDDSCPALPAEIPGVITVSAVGATADKAFYSSYGISDIRVTAPGGDPTKIPDTPDRNGRVLSTVLGGAWGYAFGTSMAAPHTAGVAALIRSTHPDWSAGMVAAALQQHADPNPCPPNPFDPTGDGEWLAHCEGGDTGRGFYGAGMVDALDAVTR